MGLFSRLRSRIFGEGEGPGEQPPVDFEPPPQNAVQAAEHITQEPSAPDVTPAAPVAEDSAEVSPTPQKTEPALADSAVDDLAATGSAELGDDAETVQADTSVITSRQERAAGLILDDERLRGALTDEEYQPLLDWALAASDRVVASTTGQNDATAEQAIASGLQAIKEVVQAAGSAVASGSGTNPASQTALLDGLLSRLEAAGLGGGVTDRARDLLAGVDLRDGISGADFSSLIARALAHGTETAAQDAPS